MTSFTSSARLTLQVTGTNNNTWGNILNTGVFQLVDDNVNGRAAFALSGTKTLTTGNGTTDEARMAILDITSGTGGTITIPAVPKNYRVRNGSSGTVTITAGGVTNAVVQAGEVADVTCEGAGTAVRKVQSTDFGGSVITSLGSPVNNNDGATKFYVDNTAFAMAAGSLPGQTGNAGKFLTTDGTTASWGAVAASVITGFSAAAAAVRSGTITTAALTPGDTYNAFAVVTITYAASVAPNMGSFINGAITLTGNLTLANPTNHKVGQTGFIELIQDGTGSRLLSAVGSSWKRVGGLGVLSTTAGVTDILVFQVVTSTLILYDILRNPT